MTSSRGVTGSEPRVCWGPALLMGEEAGIVGGPRKAIDEDETMDGGALAAARSRACSRAGSRRCAAAAATARRARTRVRVVVTGSPAHQPAVAAAVTALGGNVEAELGCRRGLRRRAGPARERAAAAPGVRSVSADTGGRLQGSTPRSGTTWRATRGRSSTSAQITHAKDAWTKGWTGKGVDVALIDSGVAPVQGLTSGNVVQGPDLSFESPGPGPGAPATPSATARTWPRSSRAGRRRHRRDLRQAGQPPVRRDRPGRPAGQPQGRRPPTAAATSAR